MGVEIDKIVAFLHLNLGWWSAIIAVLVFVVIRAAVSPGK